jgi:hypothetical protein
MDPRKWNAGEMDWFDRVSNRDRRPALVNAVRNFLVSYKTENVWSFREQVRFLRRDLSRHVGSKYSDCSFFTIF